MPYTSTSIERTPTLARLAAKRLAVLNRAPAGKLSLKAFAAKYHDDFIGFAALLDIIPKEPPAGVALGGRIKLTPNDIQRRYEAARTARDIVLKPRQVGLTTWEQARDLWYLFTRPGAKVMCICQSLSDHTPFTGLSEKYRIMFESLREHVEFEFRTETSGTWILTDGRALRLIEAGASEAAAQKKGRGDTINRLHVSEVAFWEYAEKTLLAVLECVPAADAGSEVIYESTPNGAAGVFFDQFHAAELGTSGYKAHFWAWFELTSYRTKLEPGEVITPQGEREKELVEKHSVSPEQLKWYRQKLASKNNDQDVVDQEYPSDKLRCWLVSGRQFFARDVTERLIAKAAGTKPLEILEVRGDGASGQMRIWANPLLGKHYVIAVDTSEGTGGDRGAIVVRERGTARHMATVIGQFKPWELARIAAGVGTRFNRGFIVVERNNHGHTVLRCLHAEQHYGNIWKDKDKAPGWINVDVYRTAALDSIEAAHRGGTWETTDLEILGELRTFVVNERGKAEGAVGANDDLVMAEAICWDVLSKPMAARGMGEVNFMP